MEIDVVGRPYISVCMACYNGELWLRAQLSSILCQLGASDEVVIVDDASRDGTCDIIKGLCDPRIRLFENEQNRGVDFSFEQAISKAEGEIIFLSDQDDLWYKGKVAKVLRIFSDSPETTLVISDADIIDGEGNRRGYTYFADRGRFIPGVVANILKCKFLGCAMAFRARLRQQFLPFPKALPGHDMWIGVVNEWCGKTRFIEEPLIAYRRHGRNASPETHRGLVQMLLWRWQLIAGLAGRILECKNDSRLKKY